MASSKERTAWDNPRDFLNMTDEQIISQVNEDFKNSESYQTNYLNKFLDYYAAYRAKLEDEHIREDGSNLFIPYIYNIVENAFPKIMKSLFAVRPYLPYMPVNRKDPDATKKAQNMTNLVEWEFDNKMKGRLVYNDILRDCVIYGTAISKQTWKFEERTVVKRMDVTRTATDPETGITTDVVMQEPMETTEITYDAPVMQNINLADFYFDPYATNIDNAAYVIHQYYLPMYKVLKMAEEGQLDISVQDLRKKVTAAGSTNNAYDKGTAIGMSSKTNRKNEVLIWEYWTDDIKCIVINKEIVGLVAGNPYWHRRKPFSKWEIVPVSGEFYGIGIVEMCLQLQYELNTTRNQRIDNVTFALNRMYTILRSANIDTTQLKSRPNGFIEVDSHDDLKEMNTHEVNASAYTEETTIKNDMDVTSGVYNYTRGEPADRRETATTASILSQAGNDRFEAQVLQIGWGGFSDSALQLAWLNRQYIDKETEITVVGNDGQVTDATISPVDIDIDLQIIPAPSSLFSAANKQIQQNTLVQLSNILVNNPIINQEEFFKRVFEAFDFNEPEKLFNSQQQNMQAETPAEPTTEEEPATEPTTEEDDAVMEDLGLAGLSGSDAEFMQNVTQ